MTTNKEYVCEMCTVPFVAANHNKRKYCVSCGTHIAKQIELRAKRKYNNQDVVKAKKAKWGRDHRAKKSAICVSCEANFDKNSHNAKRCGTCRAVVRKALQREIGIKHTAMRRSQDPNSYIRKRKQLVNNKQSCENCGLAFELSHEVDHIIPLALGKRLAIVDLDNETNLQLLCKSCHQTKSNFDRALIAQVDRALKAND